MFPLKEWFEFERKEHNAEWGNNILRFVRWNMLPLVSQELASKGMDYLLGRQNMGFIKELFLNSTQINLTNKSGVKDNLGKPVVWHDGMNDFLQTEMNHVNFRPLPIMEKIRNIIIAEQKKMGINVDVRANDPTSIEDKKHDKGLIENHFTIENFLSSVYTQIGQKPYKIKDHETRFGKKPDNGNTKEFHGMGLNPRDPADVEFFFNNFHKLDQEIAAESVIDFVMSINDIANMTENWTNDILAKKAICAQVYISDTSGQPTVNYVAAENVFVYGSSGRRKDYNDCNAKVIEQRKSVREVLDILGDAFDIEAEWNNLLVAITFTGNKQFTAIAPDYRTLINGGEFRLENDSQSYNYSNFLDFKIMLGYAEWTTQIQDEKGNTRRDDSFFQNNQPKNDARYQSKSRYEIPVYKAYYMAVSSVDQVMFKFGPQTFQQIEGYNDFNNNFTILTWKDIGDAISIQCIPYLDLIMEAWFKFRYEVRRAKPKGTDYNYDSMMTAAMSLFPDESMSDMDKFDKMMAMLDGSANSVWTFPIVDGKVMALTNNQLNIDKPNGLTPQALEWMKIVVDTTQQMFDVIGISPLRRGDPGGNRDSMNNQFKALESSEESTYYIGDMLTWLYQSIAVRTTLFTQDIITYKDYTTVPYMYLEKAVGKDVLNKLEGLGKTAMHRWGVFVESLNQAPMRIKLQQRIDFALQNGKITLAEAIMVEDIKSPKKAAQTLAYFEQRNIKIAQNNAMELQKAQAEQQQALEKSKQQTEILKGNLAIQHQQVVNQGLAQDKLITAKSGIDKAVIKHASDVEQIYTNAAVEIAAQERNVSQTGNITLPPPQIPQGGPPPQGISNPSTFQQQEQSVAPQSTQSNPV